MVSMCLVTVVQKTFVVDGKVTGSCGLWVCALLCVLGPIKYNHAGSGATLSICCKFCFVMFVNLRDFHIVKMNLEN